MLELEIKELWKNSSDESKIKLNLTTLLMELSRTLEQRNRNIKNRDRTEIIVALLMVPVFSYFAYEVPFVWSKVGFLMIVAWCFYLIYRLTNVKKYKKEVDNASNFKEQINLQKQYFIKEKELISSVFYWYLLPPFLANVLIVLGAGDFSTLDWSHIVLDKLIPITMPGKIIYIAFVAVLYASILWMNKKAVKSTYVPLIEDIEKVQRELDAEDEN